jgi:hypothetical protein
MNIVNVLTKRENALNLFLPLLAFQKLDSQTEPTVHRVEGAVRIRSFLRIVGFFPKNLAHMRKREARSWKVCALMLLVATRLEDLRKGRKPGYSFGDITRSCRNCFEGSSGGANVMTMIRKIMTVCRELRIREIGCHDFHAQAWALVQPATPRRPDQANVLLLYAVVETTMRLTRPLRPLRCPVHSGTPRNAFCTGNNVRVFDTCRAVVAWTF